MNRLLPLAALFIGFFQISAIGQVPPANCIRYVNPFIGTGGHGHTYPGATAPFGLAQLSPDTRIDMNDWDGCSGYHYSDSLIYGFSHTHLSGTGVADYCDVLVMPFTSRAALKPADYASPFKKSKEKAEAGYYSVFLEKDKILAELTATERVGVHRYTFPKNLEAGNLLIDLRHRDEVLSSYLDVVNSQEIAGYRISKAWAKEQHLYFVMRFSRPFSSSILLDMTTNPIEAHPEVKGKAIVGLLEFYHNGEPLVVTVGISGTSIEGARRNLNAESPHFDFDKIRAQTQAKWQKQLSKIVVEGDNEDQKTIFYTALYHTMVAPNIWNDVDGQYRGRDDKIHQAKGHDVYTVFSLWDTYRACNPLYTLLEPKRTNDFIQTFLRQYEQSGLLPIWELSANETDCMIGNHAIPVIVDAYMKGIRGFDERLALEAMLKSADQDRYGMKAYRERGYIPADQEPESVSKTLEYAYDDWCISLMAKEMGEEDLANGFFKRAHHFMNLFDPKTEFFRAKSNGTWQSGFNPYQVNFNYTEANAWQYSLAAPQALGAGSSALLVMYRNGFEKRLDDLFSVSSNIDGRNQADMTGLIGQYVHGNEPSHHMAYLYQNAYQPWKTEERVRQIMEEMYHNRPDGLSGNEDCGQMSAWYVLSALGFYPVTPGNAMYTLGTPLFERATIQLENGNKFVVEAPGVSKSRFYVKSATLNDAPTPVMGAFHHRMITQGGTLQFDMSQQPEIQVSGSGFGFKFPIIPTPFVNEGKRAFRDSLTLELGCLDPDASIYFTLDGSLPDINKAPYTAPITLHHSTDLHMMAVGQDGRTSKVDAAHFHKIPNGLGVKRYNTIYNAQYTGGSNDALINGIRGSKTDFRTGDWQGFEGDNLDFVVDLGATQQINKVTAGFLQDENAWIFFPSKMQVALSEDGVHFEPVGEVACSISPDQKGVLQQDFVLQISGKQARYVQVMGVSLGKCPEWHKGKGLPCWVFADEVIVE